MDVSDKRVAYLGIEWQMDTRVDTSGESELVVSVRRVMADSPACKAGIREGDVIRVVDGSVLDADITLSSIILARKPGATVSLELARVGKRMVVKVTLGSRLLPILKFKQTQRVSVPDESVDVRH
ncbi:MAG TPA: PDZ domain-containing protein [Anaerolineae bacterium]